MAKATDRIEQRLAEVASRVASAGAMHRLLRKRACAVHDRLLREAARLRRVINHSHGRRRDQASAAYLVACARIAQMSQTIGALDELRSRIRL